MMIHEKISCSSPEQLLALLLQKLETEQALGWTVVSAPPTRNQQILRRLVETVHEAVWEWDQV